MRKASLPLLLLSLALGVLPVHPSGETLAVNEDTVIIARPDGSVWSYRAVDRASPSPLRKLTRLTDVVSIATTRTHGFAVDIDGKAWTWRLSSSKGVDVVRMGGLPSVTTVACGDAHCLALTAEGRVWSWGANESGQLGDGSQEGRSTPVRVAGLQGVFSIAPGRSHSLALTADGELWSWGANDHGQLGDGTRSDSAFPLRVSGLEDVEAMAAGAGHSLAVLSDGSVRAWGANDEGQLGDRTRAESHLPVEVYRATGVVMVAAGADHSVALKDDGTLSAWGNLRYYQTLTEVTRISAQGSRTLAETSDGSIWVGSGDRTVRIRDEDFENGPSRHLKSQQDTLVSPPRAPDREALLVVGNSELDGLNGGDAAIKSRLESLGYFVTVRDALSVSPEDGETAAVVLLSSTAESRHVGGKFRNALVPVITWDPFLFRPLGMIQGARRHKGLSPGDAVVVLDPSHPLSRGLSGLVRVTDAPGPVSWGLPGKGATTIATRVGDPTGAAIFAYDTGALMPGLVAPERRVGFFLSDRTPARLTAEGWALFDGAVEWAAHGRTAPREDVEPGPSDVSVTASSAAMESLAAGSLDIRPTAAVGSPVLLVVGSTTLTPGDTAFKSRLETLGYVVIVKPAAATVRNDAGGKALVLISSTCSNADILDKFATVAIPVMVQSAGIYDDMYMTDFAGRGNTLGPRVTIAAPSHPMAAGLSGTVTVATATGTMSWGTPNGNGVKVATAPTNASQAIVFGYEKGAAMVGLTAPERRVGFGFFDVTMSSLTPDGARLFDAAVQWAARTNVAPRVYAGPDQAVHENQTISLSGSASDDGLPTPVLTLKWTVVRSFGTVTFGNDASPTTTVRFSSHGGHVLRLTASDGVLSSSDDVTIHVYTEGSNEGPTVDAGRDQTIDAASPLSLSGSVIDEGLPNPPGVVTVAWSKVSGPGTVVFATPNAVSTTSTFSARGTYVLRLTASDSALTSYDDVVITVSASALLVVGSTTLSPGDAVFKSRVEALGFPVIVKLASAAVTADANGRAVVVISPTAPNFDVLQKFAFVAVPVIVQSPGIYDDMYMTDAVGRGYATGPSIVMTSLSHPIAAGLTGTVPMVTTSSLLAWGTPYAYGVRVATVPGNANLAAVFAYEQGAPMVGIVAPARRVGFGFFDTPTTSLTNEGKRLFDASVLWATKTNAIPLVSAGPDSRVTLGSLASLQGYVFDDGLPAPPGVLTATWSKDTGPGDVTFGNPNAAVTTASFSSVGRYVLRLTVADGAFTRSDLVVIDVDPEMPGNAAPSVAAGLDQTVGYPGPAYLRAIVGDDGFPLTPGTVATLWSVVSGPGTATFSSPASESTSVTFSAPGIYVLRATATDGAVSAVDDVQVTVQAWADVLLVVGRDTVLGTGDSVIKRRAEGLGFTVRVMSGSAASAVDAVGKSLVVISNSSSSEDVLDKFAYVAVPVIAMTTGIYDEMGLSDFNGRGIATGKEVAIVNPSHPLAAGMSGNVGVSLVSTSLLWGTPNANATVVARAPGSSTQSVLFAYEKGAGLYLGLTAPARRIGFGIDVATGLANPTSKGLLLFDAALRWATEKRAPALFVTASGPLSASDVAIRSRLEKLGLGPTVVADVDATPADADGKVVVFVSPSVSAAAVGAKFLDARVPVVVSNASLFSSMAMTGSTVDVDFGSVPNQTKVEIVWPLHELAAGLTGTPTVTAAPDAFGWGIPAPSAEVAASIVGSPSSATAFRYETGAEMVGTTAADRRVGLFLGPNTGASLTAPGAALVDAAIQWSLRSDADGDGLGILSEWRYGTAPFNPDTNGDGILDGAAVRSGLSATSLDMDGDGIPNALERDAGTDPFLLDSDDDGVSDGSDCFPLDPARWECPPGDPNDVTPPDIVLTEPTNAVLVESIPRRRQ